jgi:hypothetical protein
MAVGDGREGTVALGSMASASPMEMAAKADDRQQEIVVLEVRHALGRRGCHLVGIAPAAALGWQRSSRLCEQHRSRRQDCCGQPKTPSTALEVSGATRKSH